MNDTPDNRSRRGPGGRRGDAVSPHPDLETLSAFLDDRLAPWDRDTVAAHTADCPDCRRELSQLRATVTLLRGLPQYEPRRSFRLGPEHAARPVAPGWEWFARLLPALPALRAATAAVALLLVAVGAGDFVASRGDEADRSRPATEVRSAGDDAEEGDGTESGGATSQQSGDGDAAFPAPTDPAALDPAVADVADDTMAMEAAPVSTAGDAAAARAPAAAAQEAPVAAPAAGVADAPAAEDDLSAAAGAQPPNVTVASGADNAVAESSTDGDGSASREASVVAVAPAVDPVAPGTNDQRAADEPAAPAPSADTGPSPWRLTEAGLGLVLLWLLVTVAGLGRLRRRV